MKTVCSFCHAIIRPGSAPNDPVSHGVCPSCYERILSRHGFNVKKFLDLFDAPVFLVDSDANILAANTLALSATKKPLSAIRGRICGDVLDCINARQSEGCGKTPLCPECVVRAAVTETYTTGRPVTRRPAAVIRGTEAENLHCSVTTRKDGAVVLLRIEPERDTA